MIRSSRIVSGMLLTGLLALSACAPATHRAAASASADLAFTRVNVVDVASGSVLQDRTVLITGNRIQTVGPSAGVRVPAGTRVVDARGGYLIPGLWDMHVHSGEPLVERDVYLPLYIAHGVTGVRELAGKPSDLEHRAAIAAGTLLGPRMVVGSPFVDGPNPTFPERSVRVASTGEARRAVDSLMAEGYNFIKAYKFLSPEVYRALHEHAGEVGMEISGEIPVSVSLWEAAALGHRTVEHLAGVELACSSQEEKLRLEYRRRAEEISADTTLRTHIPDWIQTEWEPIPSVDPERCATLYRHLAAHGTWVVPTLMIQRLISFPDDPELLDHPGQRYLPAGQWDPEADAEFFDPERRLRPTYEHRVRTLPDLHRAGVGILAGTDVPFGFTLHDELALYVRSGLPPLEALRTATLNPARYLGRTDDLGTVAPGKLADLVLLDADPLEDIRNTQRIRAVVFDGRLFDRQTLDELLAGVEAAARESVVRVAAPTGEREADRASILAALERVRPGGTVQFAPGTYLMGGEIIRVTVPRITLLGHPEGTTLRGCDPDEFPWDDIAEFGNNCNAIELAAAQQTVRNLTFEHAFWALHVGCCWSDLTHMRAGEGGHLIEGNTFRSSSNAVRVHGFWSEPTVIRNNRFLNNWHSVAIYGNTVHLLDNDIAVPEPEEVQLLGFPMEGVHLVRPFDLHESVEGGARTCENNVIAGNRIDGVTEGIMVTANEAGIVCRNNVIRDNTIAVRRARPPAMPGFIRVHDRSDSTVIGVPLALRGLAGERTLEDNLIEGNVIVGAEGLGIEIRNASRNRIVNNSVTRVVRREPFPGNAMAALPIIGGDPVAWRDANGSGIWVSPGSNENEIVGNLFEQVAGEAVMLEGDRNRVETRRASDVVRDLGSGNRVSEPTNAGTRTRRERP